MVLTPILRHREREFRGLMARSDACSTNAFGEDFQRAVPMIGVVISAPAARKPARLIERREPVRVEKFLAGYGMGRQVYGPV